MRTLLATVAASRRIAFVLEHDGGGPSDIDSVRWGRLTARIEVTVSGASERRQVRRVMLLPSGVRR